MSVKQIIEAGDELEFQMQDLFPAYMQAKSLFDAVVMAKIPHASHETDLYIPVTKQTQALLKRFPMNYAHKETFINRVDGRLWYDIPFAYEPAWKKRSEKPHNYGRQQESEDDLLIQDILPDPDKDPPGLKPNVLNDLYSRSPLEACVWALQMTGRMETSDRMEWCDKLLGTHGVEAIRGEWQNGYWGDVVALYCNTGDSYAMTVLCIRGDTQWDDPKFSVSSWGDFVERYSERYGIR